MADSVLAEADWTTSEQAYRFRVDRFLEPHLRRAQAGQAHPVWDFLFRYYSLRPRQLRVWHPGFGVVLGGDAARHYLGRTGYGPDPAGVAVTDEHLRSRVGTVRFIADLLRATAGRQAQLNCFGLHEWAMVYRAPTVRHERVPLRLGAVATNEVVESMPLRCSHFDAFRFFTEPAALRNAGTPQRSDQSGWEQPGCVHANMD
ncbi:MAG TPA: 3-methyladenine DNA glycosylase, partial [Mycobacterium sp.]